jgi:hypothetical protein
VFIFVITGTYILVRIDLECKIILDYKGAKWIVSQWDPTEDFRDNGDKTSLEPIRTDAGKFSYLTRTIRDWSLLPEEAIGTSLFRTHVFRKRVRKVYQ